MNISRCSSWLLMLLSLYHTDVEGFSTVRQQQHKIHKERRISVGHVHVTKLHGASVKYVTRSPGTLALAGQIFSTIQKLIIGKSKAKLIVEALIKEAHIGDLAVLSILGFGAVPLMKYYRKLRYPEETESSWLQSPACRIAISTSQLCKIGGIVYAVDMMAVALSVIGFQFPMKMNMPTIAGQVGFTMWFAVNLAAIKQSLLCRLFKVKTADELGRSSVYDRMGNGIIYFTALLIILDILPVKTGRAVSSVFALGSVGTLVISLASKDIAANFVSGLALSASDKFHVGESVRIGNEYHGVVHRMGWMHTDIRGHDEIITRIPNSEVANQKVSNLSRMSRSQVKQVLYFDYKDMDKVSNTIVDIKQEISLHCPKLVTDGSRPFWCHLRDIKENKLEVVVLTHFTIRHGSTEYFDTRQKVLEAIGRAAKRNDVKFAMPIFSIHSVDGKYPESLIRYLPEYTVVPPLEEEHRVVMNSPHVDTRIHTRYKDALQSSVKFESTDVLNGQVRSLRP